MRGRLPPILYHRRLRASLAAWAGMARRRFGPGAGGACGRDQFGQQPSLLRQGFKPGRRRSGRGVPGGLWCVRQSPIDRPHRQPERGDSRPGAATRPDQLPPRRPRSANRPRACPAGRTLCPRRMRQRRGYSLGSNVVQFGIGGQMSPQQNFTRSSHLLGPRVIFSARVWRNAGAISPCRVARR